MKNLEELRPLEGETIKEILHRYKIPSSSVIILKDGIPISENQRIKNDNEYIAVLIEGYNIKAIRDTYRESSLSLGTSVKEEHVYTKELLEFEADGELNHRSKHFTISDLSDYVKTTVIETCLNFNLIEENDKILLGLSGGVDSSSLLLAMAEAKEKLPSFELSAVTFEDFDSQESPAFQHASNIAQRFNVNHYIAPASLAEKVFNLNCSIKDVLPMLMKTKYAHFTMYIDHHTTRRTLEVFSKENSLNKIALGLHTTDLIGGLLNEFMTGYKSSELPLRKLPNIDYIYPLAFIQKRELHLYHLQKFGELARHTTPNQWERDPKDRNFYYYMADTLQNIWPGLESMLFVAHNNKAKQSDLQFSECENCGCAYLPQLKSSQNNTSGLCDACWVFSETGNLN